MEKRVSSKVIYSGKILNLRVDEVELEDGKNAKREIVEHRGAVVIIPVLEDGKIVMVKQYRYAVGKELLELPAGTMEKGEDPLTCAKRELLEETGYEAEKLERLITCYSSPGFCDEELHLFLATDLKDGVQNPDVDEKIKVEIYEVEKLKVMIKQGSIMDAKTIAGILYYLYFIHDEKLDK